MSPWNDGDLATPANLNDKITPGSFGAETEVVTGDASTRSTRATAVQNAIDRATSANNSYVFVPENFLNYDASAVTFDNSVRMLREGQVGDVYDVKAYGAAGDGDSGSPTDDEPAISAALSAGSGGKVLIPSGNFIFGAELVVPADTTLVGQGPGQTTLTADGGFSGTGELHGVRLFNDDAHLRDLTVDANNNLDHGISSTSQAGGVGGVRAVVSNVHVLNTNFQGIFLKSDDVHVDRCYISAAGVAANPTAAGMFISGCTGVRVTDTIIEESQQHGIYALNNDDISIEGVTSRNNKTGAGISMRSFRARITSCLLDGNGASGLAFDYADSGTSTRGAEVVVSGSVIRGNGQSATDREVFINRVDNLVFAANTVLPTATSIALRIQDVDTATVASNTVDLGGTGAANQAAVLVDQTVSQLVISGNNFLNTGPAGNGIFIDPTSLTDTVVTGNSILGFVNAIRLEDTITDCRIAANHWDSGGVTDNTTGTSSGIVIHIVNQESALSSADGSTVDATYGAEERDVIQNLVTRQSEIETALTNAGLLA